MKKSEDNKKSTDERVKCKINSKSKIKTMRKKSMMLKLMVLSFVLLLGFGIFSPISAQQRTVQGTVTDSQGSPLPGVTVVVKGTTQGTVTNADGNYSITGISSDATIVFSFVGMKTQEVIIGNQASVNLRMEEETIGLEEVVAIGYGTVRKRDLTGAMSHLSSDDIHKGVAATFDQMMQGKAAGVQVVVGSGAPGGGVDINIRGTSSIQAGNSPLYVIDGLPIDNENAGSYPGGGTFTNVRSRENPLSSINPADIESIDILKDASATAIYGARGANGVILITTKTGKSGKLSVNYNAYGGVQNVPTSNRLEVLSPQQYMTELNAILDAGGAQESERVLGIVNDGTDWQNLIFKENAVMQNHNLSFSGGDQSTSYLISLNYFNQEGVIISSDFQRYAGRINLAHSMKNFNIGLNLSTSYTHDNFVPIGQEVNERAGVLEAAVNYDPTLPAYDENGNFIRSSFMSLDNPLAMANGKTSFKNTYRTFGTIFGEYFFLPEFSAKLNLGGDIVNDRRNTYVDRTTIHGEARGGDAFVNQGILTNYLIEGTINYNKIIDNHSLNAVAGITTQKFVRDRLELSGSNFVDDVIQTYNLGMADPSSRIIGSDKIESRLLSYLARINYTYRNKYLITASFRADGSSKFGTNNKFGYFPSAALGWNLHNESFFEPLTNILGLLKLRASWGQTGNQDIGNYSSISTITRGNSDIIPFDDRWMNTFRPARMANPNLKWETTEQLNLGIDFGLANNRLNGSFEYYRKVTKDMLLNMPIPTSTGFTTQLQNVGSILNSGYELSLDARIINKEFKWNLNSTLTTIYNEVLDLGGIPQIIRDVSGGATGIIIEGHPLYSFYGYEIEGIWQTNDNFEVTIDNVHPGDIKFVDQNNDNTITADDRVILGNSFPDLMFSFGNTLTYKGFELYLFFDGITGAQIYNAHLNQSLYPTNFRRNRMAEPILQRWTPDNPTNKYPSHIYPFTQGTKSMSSLTVGDADYLRLQTARLSYNFNLNTELINSATIYLTGQNLFTVTGYSGMSPVVNSQGEANFRVDWSQYPLSRTFMLGVNVEF